MKAVVRALIGAVGVLFLGLMLGFWTRPAALAAELGVSAPGPLGLAAIRADIGGFFGAVGAFALAGAVTGRGDYLLAPAVLMGLALLGRLIGAVSGFTPEMTPPMVVEAVLLTLFLSGWRLLRRPNA